METNGGLESGEIPIHSSGNLSKPPDLRFLHYNDVYHIAPGSRDPVGGIARFTTLCRYYQQHARFEGQPELLTFFSGDAFNPSLESSVTKGRHMLGPLNNIGTSVACLGNHDLDFGVDQFQYLATQCSFPWLCANVLDPALGEQAALANCRRTAILESSNGIKIGVIGLVEREWLDTINTLPPNLKYLSASATAAELAPKLRAEGAEMIVCVTHQRQYNDEKLATKLDAGTVDIILGGHDHFYDHSIINGVHLLRSGTDFRQISYIECRRQKQNNIRSGWDFHIVRRDVVSSIPQDPSAEKMVDKITESLRPKLEKPVGVTAAPLDARFETVRKRESNLGNFVCDLMRFHYGADCCIMAAGTIRGDQIYPPGVLRVKDMMDCFPFEDPCVVIALQGSKILKALENAVSLYPALEGRFPQVSNISLTFDPSRPPGNRCVDVQVAGSPIDPDREYTLVTRDYMVRGKDGFTDLMLESDGGTARSLVSEESGLLISMILRQYFMSLKVLGRWKQWGEHMHRHWQRVKGDLHEVHPAQEPVEKATAKQPDPGDSSHLSHHEGRRKLHHNETHLEHSDSEDEHPDHHAGTKGQDRERELYVMRKFMCRWRMASGLTAHPDTCKEAGKEIGVHWTRAICPRVEGKIQIVGSTD